ncbi:MAG: outer membrane protein cobalt-zinc-cadmium efflux system, partial [Pseudomonadota bacterium]
PGRALALAAVAAWLSLPGAATAQQQPTAASPEPPTVSATQPSTGTRSPLPGRPVFTLPQIAEMARQSSPLLAVGRAEIDAAQAGTITARAYPNPELAIEPGRLSPRTAAATSGSSAIFSIGQPLENPWLREARIRGAESGVEVARARARAQVVNLGATVRTKFLDVVRLDEETLAFGEDLQITEQIRDRILLRVRTGEAPRFDLVRAEGEVEAARKNLLTARQRRLQAMAELRSLVGPALPEDFQLQYDAESLPRHSEAAYPALREAVTERNPEIAIIRRQIEQAERQVELERNSIVPQVTLKATRERDPEVDLTRIGASVSIPLVNRREGPIAEARAQAQRARLVLEQRRFELRAGLDAAWQGVAAAQARVQAIEGGVLARASTTLEIAEAAYRLGERGILEFLDAQRQFRLARNELIAARYELRTARSELERLLGNP